jgi:hypothetical protein
VTVTFHISVAGVLKWSRRCCATAAPAKGKGTSLFVSSGWPRCHSILSLAAGVASEGDFEHRVLEPQGLPMLGPSHDFLKPVVRCERKSIAQSDAKLSQFFSRHRLCPLELAEFGLNSGFAFCLVIIAPLPTGNNRWHVDVVASTRAHFPRRSTLFATAA